MSAPDRKTRSRDREVLRANLARNAFGALVSAFVFGVAAPSAIACAWRGLNLPGCEAVAATASEHGLSFPGLWFAAWIAVWVFAERRAVREKTRSAERAALHASCGPVAVGVIAVFLLVPLDALATLESRARLRDHIVDAATPAAGFNQGLHYVYFGGCGNVVEEQISSNYGDVPAVCFENDDPAVRVRALEADGYFNRAFDERDRPVGLLARALDDPDARVRAHARRRVAEWTNDTEMIVAP